MGAKEKDKMCHYDTWGLGFTMCLLNYLLSEISTDIREKGFENERNYATGDLALDIDRKLEERSELTISSNPPIPMVRLVF